MAKGRKKPQESNAAENQKNMGNAEKASGNYVDRKSSAQKKRNRSAAASRADLHAIQLVASIPLFFFSFTPLIQSLFLMNENNHRILQQMEMYFTMAMFCMTVGYICMGICIYKLVKQKGGRKGFFQWFLHCPTLVFFSLLILWMTLTSILNGMNPYTVYGYHNNGIYVSANANLWYLISYFAVFYFCGSLIEEEAFKKRILDLIMLASVLLAANSFHQSLFPSRAIPWYFAGRLESVFWNSNHYAYFMTVAIMLSAGMLTRLPLDKPRDFFYFLCYALNCAVLVMNDTLGGWLAVFGGLIFLMITCAILDRKPNLMSILLFILFWAISFTVSQFTGGTVIRNLMSLMSDVAKLATDAKSAEALRAGTNRWRLWTATIQYMNEKPISWFIGMGIDGYAERLYVENNFARNHNEFLEYLSFFGIPGLILYVSGCFSVFLHGLKNKDRLSTYTYAALAAAFGYLFSSCFGVSMIYTAPFLFITLGLGYNTGAEPEKA